jgi:signal transduction histidine kinase
VRVVNHLLENAARYAKGQPIVIQLSETSNHALLQVCDRGCGIPLADQARIFEPFYRVEHSRCRSTGGIGLGLAIVKSLVEGMQGQVTVESQPGEGSVFSVMLPLGCPNSPLPHRLSQQNL